MMGMLGYALAQGVKGVAASGVDSINDDMREQRQIAAEQRAANTQLDLQQRMAAAKEAMQQRVDERFQTILKRKSGEGIPLEIAPGDPAPQDAANMTRQRTRPEAVRAALEEASLTDGAAYRAGRGMLDAELNDERDEKKSQRLEKRDDARYELERERLDSAERRADADRKSREGIADKRIAVSASKGGAGGKGSAQVQLLQFLRNDLKWSDEKVTDYLTQSKGKSVDQIFMSLKNKDKFNDHSDEDLMDQAREIKRMSSAGSGAAPAATPAAGSKPRLKYNVATGKLE